MYVDACAIVAILGEEPTAAAYEAEIASARSLWTSPLATWEAILVLARPPLLNCCYHESHSVVMRWLETQNIVLRESDSPHDLLLNAVAVADAHGVSRRALSSFDCFHYAYAKAAGVPLLTLDQALRATDVETLPGAGVA
jgi:ribonuclease VapC